MRGREAAGVQGGWYLRQIYRFRGMGLLHLGIKERYWERRFIKIRIDVVSSRLKIY